MISTTRIAEITALAERLLEGCPTYSDNMSNNTPGRILDNGYAATKAMAEASTALTELLADHEGLVARMAVERNLVAKLYCSSGCSCCRDGDVWEAASDQLAELFSVPRYPDLSGYDWYSVRDAALKEQS